MDQLENRYANALLELSEENGTLKEDVAQVARVRDALSERDVEQFLIHPHIANAKKQALLKTTFADQVSEHLMGLLFLMIDKQREQAIIPALNAFIDAANQKLGIVEARVVSAKELTEQELSHIHSILKKRLNKTVSIQTTVDPDVLGGFYILVDGQVFDGTLRTELLRMKERLKRGGAMDASKS